MIISQRETPGLVAGGSDLQQLDDLLADVRGAGRGAGQDPGDVLNHQMGWWVSEILLEKHLKKKQIQTTAPGGVLKSLKSLKNKWN